MRMESRIEVPEMSIWVRIFNCIQYEGAALFNMKLSKVAALKTLEYLVVSCFLCVAGSIMLVTMPK